MLWNSLAIIYSSPIVCLKVLHLPDYWRKPAEEASGVWAFSLLWCLIKPAAKKTQRGGEITDATCLSLELDEALQGNSVKSRPSTESGRETERAGKGGRLLQTTISLKPILTKTPVMSGETFLLFTLPFLFPGHPTQFPKGWLSLESYKTWSKIRHMM